MKKILFILLVFSASYAQHGKIAADIRKLQNEEKEFISFSPFTKNPTPSFSAYSETVDNATIATLDKGMLTKIVSQKNNYISLNIPYSGSTISVLLYKADIFTEGFTVNTDKQRNVNFERGVFYRGIINGDENSLVSFSFFHDEMSGIISGSTYQNLVIGKLKQAGDTDYIIYSDAKMKKANGFQCHTDDRAATMPVDNGMQERTALTNHCVTMYFEIDYDMFQANDSSISTTTAWMTSVFNNVQTLYSNDGINVAINSIFVWTENDPYFGNGSYDYLQQFHSMRPIFEGDLGMLVGIDEGNGGVAATINGLCSDYNYSYSDVYHSFSTVPVFSWTVEVITHEFGHLLGSPHTHGCYWNGNDTAIDGCGSSVGYIEGDCEIGPLPSQQEGGTIMSYCHLTGIGINLANGFGPQPAQRIAQTVDSSQCLGSDCITTCITYVTDVHIQSTTATSATISWTDESFPESWEVAAVTAPFEPTEWITTSLNPYTFTNLAPNSYYRYFVRQACPDPIQGALRFTNIDTTENDDFCAGKPFVDSGGLSYNYSENENWTRTIFPLNPADKIKIVFNSVDIEEGWDYLYIFNGPNVAGTPLTDGMTGTAIEGPFISTHPTGALTLRFISDYYINTSGWDASFSCFSLGVEDEGYLDYSYFPNPATDEITIRSKNQIDHISVYSIDGRLLYDTAANATESKVSVAQYASGTYLFRLEIEGTPVSFKIVKQ